jgi:hypothetical protein
MSHADAQQQQQQCQQQCQQLHQLNPTSLHMEFELPPHHMRACRLFLPASHPPTTYLHATITGMIMWPKAKRAVSDETAAAIAAAAKQHGAQAVGVFVDEDAGTISRRCRAAGIPIAQLHGDASRAVVNEVPADLQVGCVRLGV